jgi:hypothetical protein
VCLSLSLWANSLLSLHLSLGYGFVLLISDKVQVVGLSHNWMKKIRSPWVESRNNIFAYFSILFFFLSHWIVF